MRLKTRKNIIFCVKEVTIEKIEKDIKMLTTKKASQNSDILTRIVKENADIFADFYFKSINPKFKLSIFPDFFKLADVTPLHNKGGKDLKENYRPVSILPTLSKAFEMIIFAQISVFFDNFFLKYQCWFQEDYSTQHKKCVDKGKILDALLTDFSKAFDCHNHVLFTAKLDT